MRKPTKNHPRFITLSALALTLGIFCSVAWSEAFMQWPGQNFVKQPGEEWVLTEKAAARTLEGECGAVRICRELCYFGEPQGTFQCFDN